jgi:hydroxymethylbilane synthase
MVRKITIGTRSSRLALIQTESVVARLRALDLGIEIAVRRIATSGDRDRTSSLADLGVSIFVKELEEALLDGRIDLAVHSMKDVPTEIPAGLRLLGSPERADPRDVLVAKCCLADLPAGSRIGTGSLRRSRQLLEHRADLVVSDIRGNVDTRLDKAFSADLDGVILAAAGITRLGFADKITQYLPVEEFLPDPGQGALALEGRSDDHELARIVAGINDLAVWQRVTAERAFLSRLGGGCRAPIGALATIDGPNLKLTGMVANPLGRGIVRGVLEGPSSAPEATGLSLAEELLYRGAAAFMATVTAR